MGIPEFGEPVGEKSSVKHFPRHSIYPYVSNKRISRAKLIEELLDMPRSGGNLLNMVYNKPIPIKAGTITGTYIVEINPEDYINGVKTAKQDKLKIRRGLVVLLEKKIIARTYKPNIYWFNPEYVL